jgi:hypothetical protein
VYGQKRDKDQYDSFHDEAVIGLRLAKIGFFFEKTQIFPTVFAIFRPPP